MIYAENILICIAVPILVSMFFIHGNARRFTGGFILGMLVCLLSAYVSGFMQFTGLMNAEDTAIFLSPIIEEFMKFLPCLFYILLFEPEDSRLLVFATAIGTGFATFENCCYILTNGAESLPFVMVRGLAVGVMHIVSVLALTTGLLLIQRFKAFSFAGIAGALSMSITFHALYNLLVSAPGPSRIIGYAMPLVLAAALFAVRTFIGLHKSEQ